MANLTTWFVELLYLLNINEINQCQYTYKLTLEHREQVAYGDYNYNKMY
jgi:hypothetical protein